VKRYTVIGVVIKGFVVVCMMYDDVLVHRYDETDVTFGGNRQQLIDGDRLSIRDHVIQPQEIVQGVEWEDHCWVGVELDAALELEILTVH